MCHNGGWPDSPRELDVLVSNTDINNEATYTNEIGTTNLATFTNLPNGLHAVYETSHTAKSKTTFRYIWFKIKSATNNQKWIALAEW